MDSTDWRAQPLTWNLLRTHFGAWFSRHKIALSIALAVAVVVWGICKEVAETGNLAIPTDAQLVSITNYAQSYEVYKEGPKAILARVRDEGDISIVMLVFGLVWWLVFSIQEYQLDREKRSFSRNGFIVMNTLLGLYIGFIGYVYAYPSFLVLTQRQLIVLDPDRNLVTVNDAPLGRMSDIDEFEGIEKKGYHHDWTWFGVKLKDGRYYSFNEGEFVGANIQAIAAYLNGYLKQHPPRLDSTK